MSILNLGLQSVGLMRQKMGQEFEDLIEGCNSMEAILNSIFHRQSLKDRPFKTFEAATEQEIDNLWKSILQLDPDLNKDTTRQFKHVKNMTKFNEFYDHCCRKRHYFFEIKKCGNEFYNICLPLSGDKEMFEKISNFPDPMPGNDNHYMSFEDIYGKETDEKYHPSLKNKSNNNTADSNDSQLKPTQQYVRNVGLCVSCIECNKPRVLYSKYKVKQETIQKLRSFLETVDYS
ncbi:hypothetical protein RhiirA4_490182 [Rhizophagus irregularis]|uniref:Uncharacterized protein n=1 Tax=Rhizophagus irregularis TaxID=588596 RepID=A0A2I1HVJ1_9GLOM|nr:hypothetical protein RhiirA4_490182 [Rhizophagus irregularis]